MNSLGGSKGERTAKPKFAALDINKLYITSRGESLEPSTQKSTIPRKHGMQSLGKVPSARRAPANLPSLKAEVGNPTDHSGSWSLEQTNNNNGITSQANVRSNNSFSLTDCKSISDTDSQNNPQYLSNSSIIPPAATWNTIEFPSLDDTGSAGANAIKVTQQQQEQLSSAGLLSLRSQGDTKTWVHQHTSGTRVGAATCSSSMASSMDSGSKDARGHNIQNVPSQNLTESPMPPQFRALLPSFMRGNDIASTGIPNNGLMVSSSSSQLPSHVIIPSIQRSSSNSVMPSFAQSHGKLPHHVSLEPRNNTNSRVGSVGANYSPKTSSTSVRTRNLGHGNGVGGSTGSHEKGNSGEAMLNDHHYGGRRAGPPSLSRHRGGGVNLTGVIASLSSAIPPRVGIGISDVNDTIAMKDDQRNVISSGSLSDQESIVVRPIIRDEELQRLEAISKDEGWSKDYEFDYNQKLEFSDDEMEPNITSLTDSDNNKYDSQLIPEIKEEKGTNHNKDIENDINGKKGEQGLQRNIGQHSRHITTPATTSSIVGGVLDVAEAKERLKQRREEDQKREQERKQAATKKLLELERKLSRKKSEEVATASIISGNDIFPSKVTSKATHTSINAAEENKPYCTSDHTTEPWSSIPAKLTAKSGERVETRDRYEYLGTRNDRDRDVGNGTNAMNWDAPAFSKSFQSNLPPRFQRRKLERNTSVSNTLNIPDGQNSCRIGGKGVAGRDADDAKSDPVPFSQQYDPRFIHNQQNHFLSAKAAHRVEVENQQGKLKRCQQNERENKEVERDIEDRSCDRDQRKEDRDNSLNAAKRNSKPTVNIEFSVNNERESSSQLNTGSSTPPLAPRRLSEKSRGEHKHSISSDDNHHAHKQFEYASSKVSLANSGSFVQKPSWDEDICAEDQFQASSPSTECAVSLLKHDATLTMSTCDRIDSSLTDRVLNNAVTNKASMQFLEKDEEKLQISSESNKNLLDDELHVFESNKGLYYKQMPCYDNEDISRAKHENHDQSRTKENFVEPLIIPSSTNDIKISEYQNNNRTSDGSDICSMKTSVSKNNVTFGKEGEDFNNLQHHSGIKKKITSVQQPPRDRRHDSRIAGGTRNNLTSFHQHSEGGINRGNTVTNWNRSRGAGKIGSRNYNQDYWSESDFSEEGFEDDQHMKKNANCAAGLKYQHHYQPQHRHGSSNSGSGFKPIQGDVCVKEGFTPRGEPSRRGRGGGNVNIGSALSSVSFRKKTGQGGATPIGKKVDCYGPPSSKSPFRSSDSTISLTSNPENQPKGGVSVTETSSTTAIWTRNVSKSSNDATEDAQDKNDKITTTPDEDCDKLSRLTVPQTAMASEAIPKQTMIDKHSTNTQDIVLSKEPIEKNALSSEHRNSLENKLTSSAVFTSKGTLSQKVKHPANSVENNSCFEHAVSLSNLSSTTSNVLNSHLSRIEKTSKEGTTDCSRMRRNENDEGRATPEFSCDYDENGCKTTKTDRIAVPEDGRYSDLCKEGNSFAQLEDIEAPKQTVPNPASGAQPKQQSLEDSNKSVSMNVKTDNNNKHHLDGSSPPVKTIIFENTNYKSAVVSSPTNAALGSSMNNACPATSVTVVGNNNTTTKRPQNNKMTNSAAVVGKAALENAAFKVTSSASGTANENVVTAGKSLQSVVGTMPHRSVSLTTGVGNRTQSVPHQQLQSLNTPTNSYQGAKYQKDTDFEQEIKSFAFESDISQLIDSNKVVKQCTAITPSTSTCLSSNNSSSNATTTSVQKIVSPSTADLNMKIASVKKVWEMPSISKQRDVVADDSIVTSSGSGGNEAAVHTTASYCTVMHPGHSTNYQHNVIGNTDQLSTSQGQSPYSTFPQDQGALDRRHFVNSNANKATDAVSEGGIVVIATVPGAVTAETDEGSKSYVANHQQSLDTQAASQNIQQTHLTIQQAQQPQQQSHQQLHNQQLHHQQQAQHQLQQPQQQLHQQSQLQLQQVHQHQQNPQQPQQQHHSHHHHHQQQHQQQQQQHQHQHHQQLHLQQQQLQQDQQLLQQEQQKQNQQRQPQQTQPHQHQHQPPQQHQHLPQHQHSVSTQQHPTVSAGMASLNKHSVDVLAAAAAASSANVCKVKPTQQGMHQTGNLDLSPPPSMQSGTIPSAPQPYYPAQYGVSAVPSPPAVLYNSAAAMTSQGGLYNAFQLEANGRSQFSQFPGHYGTSGASGPYNAYMATPTNIPTANPTPEIYQSITSQFRLGSVQSPYGNQPAQLNNPSTMLISSNNNSLMSSSVKSTSQQIGTIGSKSGGAVGQPPYGGQYMGMFPPAPLQNSAANFYSSSASGQNAFFGASAGSTQAYGIPTAVATANMYSGHGGQNPSNGPPPPQQQQMPNYGSQFLSSPLLGNNPVIGQQQYRGGPSNSSQNASNANAVFMKSNQPQQPSHIQQQQQQQQDTWDLQNQLMQQHAQTHQQPGPPTQQQSTPQTLPQTQSAQLPNSSRNVLSNQVGNQVIVTCGGPGSGGCGSGNTASAIIGAVGNCITSVRPSSAQGQRYPSPIQRPSNYSQGSVQGVQQHHVQRSNRQVTGHQQPSGTQSTMVPTVGQGISNTSKHYYSGNRS